MSIHNLPASIAGSKFPFDDTLISRLRRGMSILMTYNDSVMRRGIVFLEPSSNPQFMWWQSRTRFVTGEVPVCQTLLHGIDEIRWPSLKLEPVPQFEIWFAKLPFAMKLLLGHPTRGQLRAPQPLKKTPPPQSSPQQAKWPREYEIHSPPCEVPSFVNTQGPLTRKVRSDKEVRRGKRTSLPTHAEDSGPPRKVRSEKNNRDSSLAMSGHSVSPPTPPPGPSFVAGAFFWVRLFVVPPTDPTVPSTATAFLVAPTFGVVDGLKDAVKSKVPEELAGVSVLRLKVWGHDARSKRWVPLDEDTVLKLNDRATSYHVVVLPK